jgi:hypothetical protein
MSQASETAEADAADDQALVAGWRSGWFGWSEQNGYHLTRFAVLRWLGAMYAVAFLVSLLQLRGLIGRNGILPVAWFLADVRDQLGPGARWSLPTLFWLDHSDGFMLASSALGVVLGVLVACGLSNALVLAVLWALYMSLIHVGQVFYSFGWEILLLEVGFLAIFLAPLRSLRPLAPAPVPVPVIWLLRWLAFRLMFGAGLIKIRGDACWTDLTCLEFHYETQPNPSPLSWYFHQLPPSFHKGGVLFNHFVELIAPWGVFGPRRVRHVAGVLLVVFQITLILSGNLSFLNWLTIAVCLSCFDDSALLRAIPRRFRDAIARRIAALPAPGTESKSQKRVVWALVVVVAVLSLNPIVNMLSTRQAMNASFEPFHLVNTYGAFGSVTRERHEIVLEGTNDQLLDEMTEWQEYEFRCKPGDVHRRPCLITPYHYRLDWQMWFAALGDYRSQPWILRLIWELLEGNRTIAGLLAVDPFPERPPRYIRAVLYRYRFSADRAHGWWQREPVGEYLRPLSLDDRDLRALLERRGWMRGI